MMRQLLLAIAAFAALVGFASIDEGARDEVLAQSGQPRLVVFEFHAVDGYNCNAAAPYVDSLAQSYEQQKQPVVFIEYNARDPEGDRLDRWYDAYDGRRDCALPLVLVDSGSHWSCGYESFASVYSGFVDQALANPAGADLTARFTRSANDLDVSIQVVNRSGNALGPENAATLNVIVYERKKVLVTGRYARAVTSARLDPALPDGAQAAYRLRVPNVWEIQWDRAVVVALLEYRPGGASGRYESLQAAIAVEGPPATETPRPSPTPVPSATATATVVPTVTPTATAVRPSETPSGPPSPTSTADPAARPVFLPLVERAATRAGASYLAPQPRYVAPW